MFQPELDDDWSVDVSEEAVQRRQAELTDGVKGLTINDDLEKAEKVSGRRPALSPPAPPRPPPRAGGHSAAIMCSDHHHSGTAARPRRPAASLPRTGRPRRHRRLSTANPRSPHGRVRTRGALTRPAGDSSVLPTLVTWELERQFDQIRDKLQ